MAVRKIVFQRQDDSVLLLGDVIEHDKKLWLVPEWLEGPTEGTQRPARIICLDGMPISEAGVQYRGKADFVLTTPLSREILDGRTVSQNPLAIERPNLILFADPGSDF
jgi:hypothetical protein